MEEVFKSMAEFEEYYLPNYSAWKKEQLRHWKGVRCDRCGCENALDWCDNRQLIECRFCGGVVIGTGYKGVG
jgi:hypothetical protein